MQAESSHKQQVEILIVQAGQFLVGLDSKSVAQVEDGVETATDDIMTLAAMLGTEPSGQWRQRRILALVSEARHRMLVDRVVGLRLVSSGEASALPHLLRQAGVPPWIIGTIWVDKALVLLVSADHAVPKFSAQRLEAQP